MFVEAESIGSASYWAKSLDSFSRTGAKSDDESCRSSEWKVRRRVSLSAYLSINSMFFIKGLTFLI